MAESHVISALVSKRSELSGLIGHHKRTLSQLSLELDHIDNTIKIFDPEYKTRAIKPKRAYKKNKLFKHGEANRLILDVLRTQSEPITTNDIVSDIMSRKAFVLDVEEQKAMQASIFTILKRIVKGGTVKEAGKNGALVLWELS